MDIYVVQPGDDIYLIAERYNVAVTQLIQDNGLENPYDLVTGQTIVIAYPKQTYTVQEGDSLVAIADAYGITLMQLLRNNPHLFARKYIYPGETIVISYHTKGNIVTNGFIYPYINKDILIKTLPNLTYLSVLNYRTTSEGEIIAYYDDVEIIQLAKEYGVVPLMMTTTLTPKGEPNIEAAYMILQNEEYQDIFIENMLNIIKVKGFYGINIIFYFMSTMNQKLYEAFLSKISTRFTSEGYLLIVTINFMIKNVNNEMLFERIDYSSISKAVNDMIFLQLAWGTNYGPPSPVSSISNIITFLDYLVPLVSPDKVVLGIPLIGYDWELPYIPGKSNAASLTLHSSLRLARDVDAVIQFDEASQTPYFQYHQYSLDVSVEHIVWSIDSRSIDAFLKLVSEYGLKGTGLWNVMIYYPQLWLLINSQYEIQKFIPDSIV